MTTTPSTLGQFPVRNPSAFLRIEVVESMGMARRGPPIVGFAGQPDANPATDMLLCFAAEHNDSLIFDQRRSEFPRLGVIHVKLAA